MYGVTPGTLVVMCSQRGISLRKGGAIFHEGWYVVHDPAPISATTVVRLYLQQEHVGTA